MPLPPLLEALASLSIAKYIAASRMPAGVNQQRQELVMWVRRTLSRTMVTAAVVPLFVAAASGCEKEYEVTRHLSYDSRIGPYGTFDLYEPRADSVRQDRPAILAIHGGAWKGGDKVWGQQIAEEFCPFGYVVFAINYRLSSRPNGTWPAQIEDVQNALKHIRANARRFRIDPDRIASLGMSAGGHLATMVALRDDPASPDGRVSIAVNLDGEHDMTMPPDQVMDDFDDILTKVMGHPPPWSDAELRDISTVTFARPDVSVLTVHGAGDDNVYVMQGDRITDALQAAGAETEYVRIEGREGNCHEDCWRVPRARKTIHRFLNRRLAHDGDRFFEERYGTRSPLRDQASTKRAAGAFMTVSGEAALFRGDRRKGTR